MFLYVVYIRKQCYQSNNLQNPRCNQCSQIKMLTRRVYRLYVFRYQNRVNSELNSISGKIEIFDEFDSS